MDGDINKALGNEGGPWPLIVRGKPWDLSYPDLATLAKVVGRAKKLALETLDLARRWMSKAGFADYCSVVSAEMGPQRLYEWGGERCQEALLTAEGLSHFLWLLLLPHHRDLTEAQAQHVVADALAEDPGERDAEGNLTRNPYLVATLLELASQGKSKAPGAAAPTTAR